MRNCFCHSLNEAEAVVRAFQTCEIAPSEFNHQAHLIVALWYLSQMPLPKAIERMRASLHRFLNKHNLAGYHETMTLFWMRLLHNSFIRCKTDALTIETFNCIISDGNDAQLINDYFSRERLFSAAARGGWVEPDLRAFEGEACAANELH